MAKYLASTLGANDPTDGLTPEQREEVQQFQKRNASHGEVGPDGDASNSMSATVDPDGNLIAVEQYVTERGSSMPTNTGPVIYDRTYNAPISIDLAQPNDLVDVPGYGKMELGIAMSQGLVTKAQLEGRTEGRTTQNHQPNRQPGVQPSAEEMLEEIRKDEEAQENETHEDLKLESTGNQHAEETYTELVETVLPDKAEAIAAHLAETGGEISQDALEIIGQDMGLAPEEVHAKYEDTLRPAFEAQALSTVAKSIGEGVSPELAQAAVTWAYEARPTEMQSAIMKQITRRQTGGYAALAKEFAENLDKIDPVFVLSASSDTGIKVSQSHDGKIVVTTPDGKSYGWATAVKQKLVKLS